MRISLSAGAIALALASSSLFAAQITVNGFGQHGWGPDDVRDTSGTDLVGTYTNAPDPADAGGDDAAIAAQIQFVPGPGGSTYGGAVSVNGTASGSGKSNYSVISPVTGFGTGASLLSPATTYTYEMYKQHTGSGSTPAFKLGMQSTDWGTGVGQSQNGFTPLRSGEGAWDLVLVHVPVVTNNVWTTINLDHDTGTWTLFRQAGNAFFPAPPPNGGLGSDKTLDDWALDATWGPKLFGPGAKVSSVQFGLGSGQPIAVGYLDYLQTPLLNGGDVINFADVPEPSSLALLALGGVAALRRSRRQA